MINIKNLSKVYKNGPIEVAALKEINLQIENKEFVAIMGPSGSGKSTLMNILGCLDKPTRGSYVLDGVQVSTLDEERLSQIRNQKIGFVFQTFNLLPRLNVLRNVELPMIYAGVPRNVRVKQAMAVLEKVGLKERVHHKPSEISGGQRQRVAIARALVNNPSIILADEPTGNLDTRSGEEIMAIFQQLNQEGASIIVVTHEKEIALHTQRIVTCRDGRIIEDKKIQDPINARNVLDQLRGGEDIHEPTREYSYSS